MKILVSVKQPFTRLPEWKKCSIITHNSHRI